MDTIFDTPAIDLIDYGCDDHLPTYYWLENEEAEDEFSPVPAYFA